MKSTWLDVVKHTRIISIFILSLLMIGCHSDTSSVQEPHNNDNDNAKSLVSIAIQPELKPRNGALLSLPKGEELQLRAVGIYSDNTTSNISELVTWVSSDANIARVSAKGLAKALQPGMSRINATYLGVSSDQLELTITPATLVKIQLTPAAMTLQQGGKQSLVASGVYSDNTTLDISDKVKWESSSEQIAVVDNQGVLTALAAGNSTITAFDGLLVSNAVQLEVLPVNSVSLESIEVAAPSASMVVGHHQQLSAKGIYDNGVQIDIASKARWYSSDVTTVSIDAAGGLTALKEGEAVVTAEFEGVISKPFLLTVTRPNLVKLQSIEVTPTSVLLKVGESQQFTAIGVYSDNRREDITATVTWFSSDVNTLSINHVGLATALKYDSNSAVNAMKDGVVSNASFITTSPVALTDITISPISSELTLGGTLSLSATGKFDDNSNAVITETVVWQSSNTDVALVNGKGEVTGLAEGSVDITASRDGVTSNSSRVTITVPFVTIEPQNQQLGIVEVDSQQLAFWNSTSINSAAGRTAMKEFAKKIYSQFNDEFDFITVVMNNASLPAGRPTGEYSHVKNDVAGIGLSMFDHTAEFGSAGKLQGIYFLYQGKYLSTSTYGPILHEMAHRWANWIVPTSYSGHWGDELGIVGQLNNVAANFADIELYLMGLLDPSEMSDPASIAAYNLIPQANRQRIPSVATSPKVFRTLLIVMTDRPLADTEITSYNAGATLLARTDNPTQPGTNFKKMTKGKGTLLVGGLGQLKK